MKKLLVIIMFLSPKIIQAQTIKAYRIFANTFVSNALVDNSPRPTQLKNSVTTFNPKFCYGISGEIALNLSSKLDLITGLGVDIRNYSTSYTGFVWGTDIDPVTGQIRNSTTVAEVGFNPSIFIPIKCSFKFNDFNSLEFGFNVNFRTADSAKIFTEYTDGTPRLEIAKSKLRHKPININFQAAYCFKKALDDGKNFLIKPYVNFMLLSDEFFANDGNNRFWDLGLSVGVEFGKKEVKKSKKRRSSRY